MKISKLLYKKVERINYERSTHMTKYMTSAELSEMFGYCKITILKLLAEMRESPKYSREVIQLTHKGVIRTNPEAFKDFLKERREKKK